MRIVPIELETHFAEGTVNAFLAIGETISLIDTGNPGKEAFKQLKEKLHNQGVQLQDLDSIILTHTHVDHAGGVPYIQEEVDVPVFVHELARPFLEGGIDEFNRNEAFFRQFLEECGADPEKHIITRRYQKENWRAVSFVRDGDVVQIGGTGFKAIHVPGHSQLDLLFWNPQTGGAFAGDHLLKAFSINAFIEPPLPGEIRRPTPLLQYRDSLQRISKLPIKIMYPGHGEIFENHVSLIDFRLNEQENRCSQILAILSDGKKNIFEICGKMYPRLSGQSIFLGLSQIQGHLDLLESRNQVDSEKNGKVILYSLKEGG